MLIVLACACGPSFDAFVPPETATVRVEGSGTPWLAKCTAPRGNVEVRCHVAEPTLIATLAVDATEVTAEQFRYTVRRRCTQDDDLPACIETALGLPAPPSFGAGCALEEVVTTADWRRLSDKRRTLPMGCLSATMAEKYCELRGARLPTPAEWEWIAVGWSPMAALYPWGSTAECARAHAACGGQTPTTAVPVDRAGFEGGAPMRGGERILHLVGNLGEWTSGTALMGQRIYKGGSFREPLGRSLPERSGEANAIGRSPASAETARDDLGVRCVMEVN